MMIIWHLCVLQAYKACLHRNRFIWNDNKKNLFYIYTHNVFKKHPSVLHVLAKIDTFVCCCCRWCYFFFADYVNIGVKLRLTFATTSTSTPKSKMWIEFRTIDNFTFTNSILKFWLLFWDRFCIYMSVYCCCCCCCWFLLYLFICVYAE